MPDTQASTELKLFIDNDGDLYRRITTSILKNLAAKKARGVYRHDLAVKLFGYLTEAGAKKYAQEFGSGPWHKMFDVSTRKLAAKELTKDFEEVYADGGYDSLLPKKYQESAKTVPSQLARKQTRVPAPIKPRFAQGDEGRDKPYHGPSEDYPRGAVLAHASKKLGQPRSMQIARIEARRAADTAAQESSGGISARDIWEFSGFLRNASDRQLQGIFEKEKRAGRDEYVGATRDEADRRGVELYESNDHARRKQLDREILQVVPSYRGRGR